MTLPRSWIGRSQTQADIASLAKVSGLRALIEDAAPAWPDGLLAPLSHWLHFVPGTRQSALGEDGHPQRGGAELIPPIDLPRRMWAGSRVRFIGDIAIGSAMERRSTILSVEEKAGRSGRMVFVTIGHEIAGGGRVAIREEQDIVFREAAPGRTARAVSPEAREAAARVLGPVDLFRYSALTFNAHRIHYDRDYAREVEGYPDLVVQGPLLATLLLAHVMRQDEGAIAGFSFRAERPLFAGDRFDIVSDGDTVRALRVDGSAAMTAQVDRRP